MNTSKCFLVIFIIISLFKSTEQKNPYRVLNIPAYASFKEIKAAYRNLSKIYHPDKNRNSPNQEEFKIKLMEINEAYEKIKENRNINDNDEDDNHIMKLVIESFLLIIAIITYNKIFIWLLKKVVWILETVSYYFLLAFSIFYLIDKFFSHYFEEESNQLIFSVLVIIAFILIRRKGNNNTAVDSKKEKIN